MKILLASLIALSSVTPAMAHHSQSGYSSSRDCYKTVYIEDYMILSLIHKYLIKNRSSEFLVYLNVGKREMLGLLMHLEQELQMKRLFTLMLIK